MTMRSKKTIKKALLCMSLNETVDYCAGLEEIIERVEKLPEKMCRVDFGEGCKVASDCADWVTEALDGEKS